MCYIFHFQVELISRLFPIAQYSEVPRELAALLRGHTYPYFCLPSLIAVFEPLGGVLIGSGDTASLKPALFVVSCGEGHLDLRTADKVHTYIYYTVLGSPHVHLSSLCHALNMYM